MAGTAAPGEGVRAIVARAAARRIRDDLAGRCALLLSLALAGCGGGIVAQAPDPAPVIVAPPTPTPTPTPTPIPVPVPIPVPAPPAGGVPAGHVLVWADEFNTPGLPDPARWLHDTGRNRAGWHNNERQYYADKRPENAVVRDGKLVITARLESLSSAADWGGQRYTSARLISRGLADWTYGYFEVRAKLPCGQGTWPAIWTLGSGGAWPDDGELDILEQVGSNPARVFSTVHTQVSGGPGTGAAVQVADACSNFHNYQMHWTADAIEFAVDGVAHYRYPNPRQGRSTWPFDAPQFLILNLAIGGDLGGAVDDRIFPVMLEIEHVRVYLAAR